MLQKLNQVVSLQSPRRIFLYQLAAGAFLAAIGWVAMPVHGESINAPVVVKKNQAFLPFADAPIYYRTSKDLTDPIAKLQKQLDQGEVQLKYEPQHGYLKSVLEALRIPINSQTLVFSKTSFQFPHITPTSPRALYFNDDIYVGQVHSSTALEFVSFDATQGSIFYILNEEKSDRPRFERSQLDCVQCHIASSTRSIPGVMVRSVHTSATGYQKAGTPTYTTGHESPFRERWGGWYVTGTHGKQTHMGNTLAPASKNKIESDDYSSGWNVTSLKDRIDTSRYLTEHSDIVAHLVLAHQTQMHNYMTEANYRTRLDVYADRGRNEKKGVPLDTISDITREQINRVSEELVRYLLFIDEVPLEDEVRGTSGFAEEFSALGPRDPKGRSLRDFDLQKRIFKYPCSYLIYSEAFDAIPSLAKERIYQRLLEILSGKDQSADYASLSAENRRAILEILVATKPGLPAGFKQSLSQQPAQAAE